MTLEELLDEDDLLQECKAHNTKLLEYLRNVNVLTKLLNYITSDMPEDNAASFKWVQAKKKRLLLIQGTLMYHAKYSVMIYGQFVKRWCRTKNC